MKISEELHQKIFRYIQRYYGEIPYDWHYSASLNAKQIEKVIEQGEEGLWEIEDELRDVDWEYDQSEYALRDTLNHFSDEIIGENSYAFFEEFDVGDLIENYFEEFEEMYKDYIGFDLQISKILPEIARLNIVSGEHNSPGYLCGSLEYDEVADDLEFFGVNPNEIGNKLGLHWPDIPRENPALTAEQLLELWENATSPMNQYTFLIGMPFTEFLSNKPDKTKNIVIKAGTPVTLWDRWNGSCSIEQRIKRDITLEPGDFEVYEDRISSYSIDDICGGLHDDYWSGEMTQ